MVRTLMGHVNRPRNASTALLAAGTSGYLTTFTRAGTATYFDSARTLQTAAVNVPRYNYSDATGTARALLEGSRTNSIRNPRGEGASPGTPGTDPTNWNSSYLITAGIIGSVVGSGTESGIPYVDYRIFGTATADCSPTLMFETSAGIPAAQNDRRTTSFFARLVSGAWGTVSTGIGGWEYDGASGFLASNSTIVTAPTTASLSTQRYEYRAIVGSVGAGAWRPFFTISVTNGTVVDVTVRIGAPQDEAGVGATSVILPAAGTPGASTRIADSWVTGVTPWLSRNVRTNQSLYSADLSNPSWANSTGITVTADATAAPDTTVSADLIVPTVANVVHHAGSNAIAFTAGLQYTCSVYAKPSGYNYLHMRFPQTPFGVAGTRAAAFDLSNGTIVGSDPNIVARITPANNGFYRCSITMTALVSAGGFCPLAVNSTNAVITEQVYVGDGASGIYMWGGQVEAATTVGSYIQTAGVAVTRTYSTPLTFIVRMKLINNASNTASSQFAQVFQLNDGTTNNYIDATLDNGRFKISSAVGGVNQTNIVHGFTVPIGSTVTLGVTLDYDSAAVCFNGGAVSTDASNLQMPPVDTFILGKNTLWPLYGEIERVAYYPYRMSNAQLQAATV